LREFNYPDKSEIKTVEDVETRGIKAYFCSDVCCAYKRTVYEELGGFVKSTIFNEDMLYAAGALKAGYQIAYAAKACVVHSHNYTCIEQLHRNFDLGVSQADHPEVFAEVPSESEGIKSVKATAVYLKENRLWKWMPYLIVQSGFKYIGYRLGKMYKKLPKKCIMKLTMNKEYWEQIDSERENRLL
jgi:rhamnosyltransferase